MKTKEWTASCSCKPHWTSGSSFMQPLDRLFPTYNGTLGYRATFPIIYCKEALVPFPGSFALNSTNGLTLRSVPG